MDNATKNNPSRTRFSNKVRHIIAAGLTTLLLAPAVQSAPLTLADRPLFVSTAVSPNVFFEIDDSGSMDWEILTTRHWRACDYDKDAPNDEWDQADDTCSSSQRDDGKWYVWTGEGTDADSFEYIYVNSDNSYDQECDSERETLFSCGSDLATNEPYQSDWRIFSSHLNVLFYNPAEEYTPWTGPCLKTGSDLSCTDAQFDAAKSDPRVDKDGYTIEKDLDGFIYEVWTDSSGYTGSQPERGDDINYTTTLNKEVDLWDTHRTFRITANNVVITETTYLPTSSGLNPTTTNIQTLSGSNCHTELGGGATPCRTVADLKTNVANWYSYYRKRSFIAKAGLSAVLEKRPSFRYGLDTINEAAAFIEMPATVTNYSVHNSALLAALYDTVWPASGTPLREGLERTGEYYDGNLSGKDSPILDSCQKNYAVLITDGYWNGSDPSVGNADGDAHSNTVADVAKYYHNIDFDSSMANVVPDDKCDVGNVRCDTEKRQHMVTYTLAFGVTGNLTGSGDWPDNNPLLAEGGDWGDPYIANSPDKIDDLWHAAWNSYGKYINVSTPGEAVNGLTAVIEDAGNRTGSSSAVVLNSGFISEDTRVYQAVFDGTDWTGDINSIPVGAGGVLGTPVIRASEEMPVASARTILTYDGSAGIPFQWTNLTDAMKIELDPNAIVSPSSLGSDMLDYLRGDQSMELTPTGGLFRVRPNTLQVNINGATTTLNIKPLGDIINSSPAFAGPPSARYPDVWSGSATENLPSSETYSSFKNDNRNRDPIIYVGTNAGYLSGFDANTMIEQIAYIPGTVFENLDDLTDPTYSHRYYADGSPTVIDAFFQGDISWHTVLVAGLNNGGQGVYALDVTDPSSFSETGSAPATTVLWEFTDSDDADLGYTFSRPAIVRMHNGVWAAVFGNGYNNSDSDGNQSSTGNAYLYIVNIENGNLIRKINTGVGSTGTPNGLATPAVIDTNGDFIADFIYAGDLEGNLWKFDVTSSDPTAWGSAFATTATPPVAEPLYIATDSSGTRQPITTRPDIGRGPHGVDFMVYFGTGIYLGTPDLADTSEQTFYGILDKGANFAGRSTTGMELIEQTVTFQNNNFRVTSDNTPSSTSHGWYMDLPDLGERHVANPVLRAGRIIFVTTIPDTDLCTAGGDSWLMELDALTGARLGFSPFDINGDNVFSDLDYIDTDGDGNVDTIVTGIKFDELIPTPGILPDKNAEYKFTSDSSGNLNVTLENLGPQAVGRQSWGQLR